MRPRTRPVAPDPALTAARWAAPLLALTLVAGAWMRAIIQWPALGSGLRFDHLVHAHSHVAFFGWVVLAFAAIAARRSALPARRARALSAAAHAVGALSVAAFVSFGLQGYGAVSIALSAAHVLLWTVLATLCWPMARATPIERVLLRTAFGFLLLAGAASMLPVALKVQGIEGGWWREFGIKLFVALFIHGFVGIGIMGAIASRVGAPARVLQGAGLTAAGVFPLALLYVATPAPAAWIPLAARAGAGLVGLGTLWFAVAAWRAVLPPLLRGAVAFAAVAGGLELLAASGVGLPLLHGRPVTLAFSHLLLLGVATPALLHACRDRVASPAVALAATLGVGTMVAALAVMGWPWALGLVMQWQLSFSTLLALALAGALASAGALLVVLVSLAPLAADPPHALPVVAPRPAQPADAGGAFPAR